jgi:hypothetical protein
LKSPTTGHHRFALIIVLHLFISFSFLSVVYLYFILIYMSIISFQADLTSGPAPSFVGGGLVHAVPVGVEVVPASMHAVKCPRCWRYASAEENTPCPRCAQAMA